MPPVNGNLYVKGTIRANVLLFNEFVNASDTSRGANIDLINGRMIYKIDDQNSFEFVNKTELDELIANGGGGSTTASSSTAAPQPEYDIMNLVNTTFFTINDHTKSYLLNLNFDCSSDIVKAGYQLDKVLSSVYKNGTIRKCEY